MQIVLLENVTNLGGLGEIVNVKPGFARNFLIPQGKAVPATKTNVAEVEVRRAELEKAAAEVLSVAQARAEALDEIEQITITAKTGDEGRLFGSIGTRDIADAMVAVGIEVTKAEVRLPEGAIRQAGIYQVTLHLHAQVDATVEIAIVPEG